MPGVACARSLARKRKKRTSFSHRRSAETFRHSPRDCFNGLFRALPGEPGFLATITGGSSRQLDISVGISGPRDFTVCSPAVRHQTGAAPSHPALTSVTIAKRPFDLERDAANHEGDLGSARSKIFLQPGLDRANQLEAPQQNRFLAGDPSALGCHNRAGPGVIARSGRRSDQDRMYRRPDCFDFAVSSNASV